jgi:hypothetical protein
MVSKESRSTTRGVSVKPITFTLEVCLAMLDLGLLGLAYVAGLGRGSRIEFSAITLGENNCLLELNTSGLSDSIEFIRGGRR